MTNNFTPKKSGTAARPQLSPEEYAAKKKAEKDAVYQMIDDTATEIVSDPDKFRAYLDTQARMDRYSAANALLIYKQQPQATQLKDFRDWQEDGVKVNKGAKSLSILEPVEYTKNDGSTGIAYNVKKVFDVAQTSGKKPAAPTLDRDPRKLVAIMENSLSRMRPHLVSEWSEKNFPLTPDTVTFGSNKTVWWKGACGHEWQTSIKARSAGEQCPICSGARVLRGYNDFESKFPELAKEWSPKNEPLRPSMITAATHRKVIWRCKLGHEWTASVKSRTVNGTGCPYCSHNFVLPGFNDLASRFPEIAAEWSERNLPLTPDQVTAFKNIKVWWKCHLGHEWNTLISTRAGGSQCPYCSGIKLLKGFNDLKTKYPSLAAEWSEKNLPLTPDAVNEKSTKNVWWKCRTCGYEWKAVVKARVKGGMCPVCAERAVLQGYNDLGTTDPHLLSEWDFEKNSKWTPSNVSRNSMKVVWWKCGAGHSYRAKITDRTIEQKGCPQCEAEFQQALPQMLIMMYGAQNGITVKSNSDSELGMRLVAYLPELHCAVDIAGATVTEKREQSVKAHICQSNRLGYYLIKKSADTSQMAAEIKTLFIRNHIYLHTDSEKDVQVLRERFLEWKNRNACKLNGKY